MTDIEQKALALLKECVGNAVWKHPITQINREANLTHEALCRAIEQREVTEQELSDHKQEVSDAVEDVVDELRPTKAALLSRFIIQPKTDPLVEVVKALQDGRSGSDPESYAACLRNELKSRGLEIREVGQ